MRRHIGVCVAIMAMLLLASVAAKANDLPPPDPADTVYTITLERDIPNTARCLGDLSTALCALETFIACKYIPEIQAQLKCEKAGYRRGPPLTGELKRMEEARPKDTTIYRIAFFYRLDFSYWPNAKQVAELKRRTIKDIWIEPGDAVIRLQFHDCIVVAGEECKPELNERMLYSLYKKEGGWSVRDFNRQPSQSDVRQLVGLPD